MTRFELLFAIRWNKKKSERNKMTSIDYISLGSSQKEHKNQYCFFLFISEIIIMKAKKAVMARQRRNQILDNQLLHFFYFGLITIENPSKRDFATTPFCCLFICQKMFLL